MSYLNTTSNNELKLNLLIMDDDAEIAEYISDTAELIGCETTTLTDPTLFTDILATNSFDIIVLDLVMPGKDGIELLRVLAEISTTSQLILVSGYDESVLGVARELAEAHGLVVLDHFMKPIRVADFLNTLKRFQLPRKGVDHHTLETYSGSNSAIITGIENGQFCYAYQPQINLRNGKAIGYEALARWQHPSLGTLAPDYFIQVAEQNNLIDELTWSLLKASLNDIKSIIQTSPNTTVSINLSTKQLSNLALPDQLNTLFQEQGIPTSNIIIEITETGLLGDLRRSLDILARFRMKGFKMSIDDFGTGSAMYEQLYRLPVTELKVDRSFVTRCLSDKKSHAIVDQTISLAHELNLSVVAEGVETQEIADVLIEMGCDIGQGYLYGKPLPINHWLKSL